MSDEVNRQAIIERQDYWASVIRLMMRNFRAKNPNNTMSSKEVFNAMMMAYNREGLVGQAAGKWILPQIDDPQALIEALEKEYAVVTTGITRE